MLILGIIALVAAPKFIDLQVDARNAKLNEMKGVLSTTAKIAYIKSTMQGIENVQKGQLQIDGKTIDTVYGFPDSDEILAMINIEMTDWSIIYNVKRQGIVITLGDASGDSETDLANGCYVAYRFNHYHEGEDRLQVIIKPCH